MQQEHETFMRVAIEEARKTRDAGNYPVGCVVTKDRSEVVRGANLQSTTFDVTAHGETVALRKAGAALQRTDFNGYTLYTTLEPCPMCAGAIIMSEVSRVVIGASLDDQGRPWGDYTMMKALELAGWTNKVEVITGVLAEECAELIR